MAAANHHFQSRLRVVSLTELVSACGLADFYETLLFLVSGCLGVGFLSNLGYRKVRSNLYVLIGFWEARMKFLALLLGFLRLAKVF